MPQRFLRPGITTSIRFNRLSWQAQSFYIRLLTLVDDFGRYEAEPMLLRSHAFPLGNPDSSEIKCSDVENICKQLSANGLAVFYEDSHGKKFVEVSRWQERPRAEKSKFAAFDDSCKQMFSNDIKCSPPSSSSSSSPSSDASTSSPPADAVPKKARPKSQADIIDFCIEIGLPKEDGEYLWEKWEGNGYRNNGDQIKDWKATIRSWKTAAYLPSQKQNGKHRNSSKESPRNIGTANEGKSSQYKGVGTLEWRLNRERMAELARSETQGNGQSVSDVLGGDHD